MSSSTASGHTEFEILKASHRFLRPEDEKDSTLPWNDQVAKKYYSSLYREFAVCDLKHYKSGNFSLRWRTEDEVISGAGESTCGNTRCPSHDARHVEEYHPSLSTLELPFSYVENEESNFALVKVVLCSKCTKKLMYKRNKEKHAERTAAHSVVDAVTEEPAETILKTEDQTEKRDGNSRRGGRRRRSVDRDKRSRNSRSRSPARRRDNHQRSP